MSTLNLGESDYDRHIGQVQVIEQEGYNISPQKPASDLGLPDSFFEYTPRVTDYTGPCMTVYGYQEAGDSLEYSFKLHDLQKGKYEHESFTLKSGEKKPLAEKKPELRGNGGAVIDSKFPQLKAHFIELFPTLLKNDVESRNEAAKTPARSGDGDVKFALKRNPLCWYSVSHSGWGGPDSGKGPQFGYSSFEGVFFNFAFNGSGFKFAPDHGRKAAEFVKSRRSEF